MNYPIQNYQSTSQQVELKKTLIQLLSNLANQNEIDLYLKRFINAGKTQFAVIKVGGAILENDLDNLCSSLAFLQQIGLYPIVVHGGGPQLNHNLKKLGIESDFIDGQRVTTPEILTIARKTFVNLNLNLANKLQTIGVKSASITSGIFIAEHHNDNPLGLVGNVEQVNLEPIATAIENGAIPIISSLAETKTGQCLNINADMATNQLAVAIKPYKIIFLTQTGGILDNKQQLISSINLITDYSKLIEQPWLNGGMKLKLKQIADILSNLPTTASVSITTPSHLAKELFTHKGSGTLVRKGESIMLHSSIETIKTKKLKSLLESGFRKQLKENYFETTTLYRAYITYCYRAAAIFTLENGMPYLDKFVVAEDAKGEGLGKTIWSKLISEVPIFFWRSKPGNPINTFYFQKADGCHKTADWITFWCGIKDFQRIQCCVDLVNGKTATLS